VPPSVYLLVGSNPGLSDSVCVSFSDRSEASSLDLLRAFSVSLPCPSSSSPSPVSPSHRRGCLSFSLSSLQLHGSKPRAYIYAREGTYVRELCAFVGTESGRNPSLPHTGRTGTQVVAGGKRTDTQTDTRRRREIPLRNSPSLSVRIYPSLSGPSHSLSLSLSLSPSFSLRRSRGRTTTRPLAHVRTCRAGRNQPPGKPHSASDSRHFAVPLVPDDTRKPMESANTTPTSGPWKRIRETPGKSHGTSLARSPGPWSRTPAAGIQPPIRTSAPHRPRVLAVTSECWKLRRLVAITARIAIGRRLVRPFARDRANISIGRYPAGGIRRRRAGRTRLLRFAIFFGVMLSRSFSSIEDEFPISPRAEIRSRFVRNAIFSSSRTRKLDDGRRHGFREDGYRDDPARRLSSSGLTDGHNPEGPPQEQWPLIPSYIRSKARGYNANALAPRLGIHSRRFRAPYMHFP